MNNRFEGLPRFRTIRIRNFEGKRIKNTRRVERTLSLIKFLKEFRTIRSIANHLQIHEKTVQNYLNLMVQLGFTVEVSHCKYSYYRIKNGWKKFI